MYNEIIDTLYSKSDKLNWSAIPCEKGELISKEFEARINGATLSKYCDFQVNSYDYPLIEKIARIAEETCQVSKVKKDASRLLMGLKTL